MSPKDPVPGRGREVYGVGRTCPRLQVSLGQAAGRPKCCYELEFAFANAGAACMRWENSQGGVLLRRGVVLVQIFSVDSGGHASPTGTGAKSVVGKWVSIDQRQVATRGAAIMTLPR